MIISIIFKPKTNVCFYYNFILCIIYRPIARFENIFTFIQYLKI